MELLKKLLERTTLNEARAADGICSDPAQIQQLTTTCVAELKKSGQDVGSMPMALVAQRVRSTVDGTLIDRGIRLNAAGLESVVLCILDEIRKNGDSYGLFESDSKAHEADESAAEEKAEDKAEGKKEEEDEDTPPAKLMKRKPKVPKSAPKGE